MEIGRKGWIVSAESHLGVRIANPELCNVDVKVFLPRVESAHRLTYNPEPSSVTHQDANRNQAALLHPKTMPKP